MADFDLTQTDAQVQSILNDGQNMQGAGAQTTLTTESVLLKDVNGNYHKILKSSFTEAIRDTLAGLLVNNDKGTTINQIAAIANSDFGSITPANLASVLGASKTVIFVTGGTAAHRKFVFTNVTKNKSFAKIFYNRFNGAGIEEYTAYYTANETWALSPTNTAEPSFTSINDMAISAHSGLTVVAFNCDAEIQTVS